MDDKFEWGYCHRAGLGINTNMFVEAFHRVLKHVYLKGKSNKRVDYCLFQLLWYARDKSFERVMKSTKGNPRMKTINERHIKSIYLSPKLVQLNDDYSEVT